MSRSTRIVLAAVLAVAAALAPRPLPASEAPDQLYLVHDMLVVPAKAGDVEAYLKGVTAQMRAQGYPFAVAVYRTLDFHYLSFIPVGSFADVDALDRAKAELRTGMGPAAFDSLVALRDGALQQHSWFVMRRLADVSYVPEHPRNPPDQEVFRHWVLMYPVPGKEEAVHAVLAKFRDLYVRTQLPATEIGYEVELGSDLPLLIGEERARSYFDFYGYLEEGFKVIGEEGSRLWWQETMLLLRKIERRDGVYRPDLSYVPAQ
ncbi:MAG: hypothetical protein AB1505_25160 [Candidatus Latescibacterota bacterium]